VDRAERGSEVLAAVMNELKNRGLNDILISVVDGLKSPANDGSDAQCRSFR